MLRRSLVLVAAAAASARADAGVDVVPGGLVQVDARRFVDDSADPHVDQILVRSLRPELAARFDGGSAELVPDFAGGKLVVQDAFVDAALAPGVAVRAGKMKVPFGLERLQREGTTMFVERGLPSQLAPNRDVGIELLGALGVVQWQAGMFDGVPDGGSGDGDGSDAKDYVMRVVVAPRRGLVVGAAATYGHEHGTSAAPALPAYRTQGGTTVVAFDPSAIADGTRWRWTAHGHWYSGPFGALAEAVRTHERVAADTAVGAVNAAAWQVETQWVVTGEDATYDGVVPRTRRGAFDVVARYDELRVDGGAFTSHLLDPMKAARRARGYGVGADWFASAHLRATLDMQLTTFRLGFADATDRPDELVITARLQAAF